MKNLRRFPVYLFIVVTLLSFQESGSSFLYNWKTLLWVKAEAGVSPLDVWTNSNYPSDSSNLDLPLKTLLSTNVSVFRSCKIDIWSVLKPSRLRLLFLCETGSPLIMLDFNSSDANNTEWFSAANLLQTSPPSSDKFNISYGLDLFSLSRLEVTFGVHSQPDGVFGLYAGALKYNSSQYFLFSADGSLLYLPVSRKMNFGKTCMQTNSYIFEFQTMQNFTRNSWNLCASFCREQNFRYSFLYNTSCGCEDKLNNSATGVCNGSCPGNNLEFCGGTIIDNKNATFISITILENNLDVAAFKPNSFEEKTWTFRVRDQVDLGRPFHFRNGSITVPENVDDGSNLTLKLSYKRMACNNSDEDFHIETINIANKGSTTNFLFRETIGFVCIKLELEGTAKVVNYNVTLKAWCIKGPALLTAPILAVQAAYDKYDCEVYRLLCGDSPYKNMTHAEKEQALQDTIEKIKKELTVNKSELSATIRKKTSAEDSRVSAVVIGSTLGVAVLCCSLGLIILLDLPRLLEGFLALVHNLTGR